MASSDQQGNLYLALKSSDVKSLDSTSISIDRIISYNNRSKIGELFNSLGLLL